MQYKFTIPGRLEGLNTYTVANRTNYRVGGRMKKDSLTKTKVLQDDNRRCIPHFYHDVSVDKENPRIEVTITELTPDQTKMLLRDLLKDLETG